MSKITNEVKFDLDDITIFPSVISEISSRKNINIYDNNSMLPLFSAPMFDVIDENNSYFIFKNHINTILPRTKDGEIPNELKYSFPCSFRAISLNDLKIIYNDRKEIKDRYTKYNFQFRILIDIANGHMIEMLNLVKKVKEYFKDTAIIMIGNIANPQTYKYIIDNGINADYVRCSIGGGSRCLTTQNAAVNYPMGSLIHEIYQIKEFYSWKNIKLPKIVADGGLKDYADIIKALALGADYCMIGGIINKALESAGKTYLWKIIPVNQYNKIIKYLFEFKIFGKKPFIFYKLYRGMSTKSAQKQMGKTNIKTSEGTIKYNKVEYLLSGWVENFEHYLSSAMSYSNAKNLNEFIGKCNISRISENARKRFKK